MPWSAGVGLPAEQQHIGWAIIRSDQEVLYLMNQRNRAGVTGVENLPEYSKQQEGDSSRIVKTTSEETRSGGKTAFEIKGDQS